MARASRRVRSRSARPRRANRAYGDPTRDHQWGAASSMLVTGRDDTKTRVLQALAHDYGDDAADVEGLAATLQRSPSAIRQALAEMVREGAVAKVPAEQARYYRGPARYVYRIDEDYGRAVALESAWAQAARMGDTHDPEAAYLERYGDALEFDPSAWEDEAPGAAPQARYEVSGPEEVSPGIYRWQAHDGALDFETVGMLYAARGWEAAGEDRQLEGVEDALVILSARVRATHRGQGLPTLLYEAALREAERRLTPLASAADRTYADSRWWARQKRKGRAVLRRYEGESQGGGGSRYVVGLGEDYPESLNPPRRGRLRITQEARRA